MPALTSTQINAVFNDEYHAAQLEEAARSAAVVVPLLVELLPSTHSVVDAGCGTGAWLHEFQLRGSSTVMGLDGADIPPRFLQIDPSEVLRVDLTQPLPTLPRFDVALSLDVGSCIPSDMARQFVNNLTRLSDLVVFSAAVPGQSTHPAVNERWPSYWSALFTQSRFVCFDLLRERLWYDQRVDWHYAQNMLIFASEFRTDLVDHLLAIRRGPGVLDIIHPRAFEFVQADAKPGRDMRLVLYPFRLVEEGYDGYNILQIDTDKFLALAQSEGAYSPDKLTAGGYTRAFLGASVDEAKAKIPREVFSVTLVEEGYRGYNILQVGANRFVALPQSDGEFSQAKLAAGGYANVYSGPSAKLAKRAVKEALLARKRARP